MSPPRARPEVSQCLAPYTSKLRWWLRGEVRHQGMSPLRSYQYHHGLLLYFSLSKRWIYCPTCEDCKTGVVHFKATVYGLVSVYGEAKAMFRRQGLKSPMVMVYRASWKHRGCFSKLFLTTMALAASTLVQDLLAVFFPFPSPWSIYIKMLFPFLLLINHSCIH